MQQLLQVKIISPNKVIFESQAKSVSSKSSLGPFDILPQHANIIALIQRTPISVVLADGKKMEFKFPMAIVYNIKNVVKIYTDILAQPNIEILK